MRKKSSSRTRYICATGVIAAIILVAALITIAQMSNSPVAVFQHKADLLYRQIQNFESPDNYVVFLSVCNGEYRTNIYLGRSNDLEAAWAEVSGKAIDFLKTSSLSPKWVKADIVYSFQEITSDQLSDNLRESRSGYYRYGLAFDADFDVALLEQELNYAGIYDYDTGSISLDYINSYLSATGRQNLTELPETYIRFQCCGWICDTDNQIYELSHDGLSYGRRLIDSIDADYAYELVMTAADYLRSQLQFDGKFVYGIYPRFQQEIDDYNILRHAGTIWSLIEYYQLTGDESVQADIELAISYLLSQVVHRDADTAYVLDNSGEIKLGACGLSVIVLTQYMAAFDSVEYLDTCRQLGNGILTFLDQDTGAYVHVLDRQFNLQDEYRTVYYDGEATFALCLLYEMTSDGKYLDAAKNAADYFITNDYDKTGDHWISYTMRSITALCPDKTEYYEFALKNIWTNLDRFANREDTSPISLEALMAAYDVYSRMAECGTPIPEWFGAEEFLEAIKSRVDNLLNGRIYPEVAMYFNMPDEILNAHMVRDDSYRIRIDDVQHVIGGFYMYAVNYDKLME